MCTRKPALCVFVQEKLRSDANVAVAPREFDSDGVLSEQERSRRVLAQRSQTTSMGSPPRTKRTWLAVPIPRLCRRCVSRLRFVCCAAALVLAVEAAYVAHGGDLAVYVPLYKLVRAGQDDYHYADLVAACPALADVVCVGPASPLPAALARNVTCASSLAVRSARRWTEIDLGWLVSSETLLPPREDGTPQRRVPVLVIEEVRGWASTKHFTFYPALGPFLDIPPTHIAGALREAPQRFRFRV